MSKNLISKTGLWLINLIMIYAWSLGGGRAGGTGDQIGRIFALCVMVYFEQFFLITEVAHFFPRATFSTVKCMD
jgi:hypothetical protein